MTASVLAGSKCSSFRPFILLVLLSALFSACAWSQTQLSSVFGTVTDPGAQVAILNQSAGLKRNPYRREWSVPPRGTATKMQNPLDNGRPHKRYPVYQDLAISSELPTADNYRHNDLRCLRPHVGRKSNQGPGTTASVQKTSRFTSFRQNECSAGRLLPLHGCCRESSDAQSRVLPRRSADPSPACAGRY